MTSENGTSSLYDVPVGMLIDGIPELAWSARADGYIDFFNRRWFEYTGKTPEEMLGWGWKAVHHPDMVEAVVERWQRCLATGEPFEMEFPLRGADGSFRWFLSRVAPVKGAGGAVVRWFGTNTDVHEFRELREALATAVEREKHAHQRAEALCEEALRAVRAREEILAIVSHDLRNPLGTVLMSAHQITTAADESTGGLRTKKAAKTIVKAVDRMNRLIGDLLDLATLEAGHPLPIELGRQDIVGVIRDAAELLEPVSNARQLQLQSHLPAPILVVCDGNRLLQAVANLIGNAIKFTGEGGTIDVAVRRSEGDVLVTVRDTGIGIPASHLSRIFEPYWQADAQRRRGAGLGLSIVKAIVETHGGRVWVESAPGHGSTFYFTIPVSTSLPAPRNRDD
jgi:PAS domain S-box-containing protein